ncbi:GNAT family N-acetyltransferase [Brachybacterium sp. JHP9]|uniref:GNAT family N-acetyltransferase n=1 Tax=Brachybacterium equifaecis TaxID=2910770 RepID=A0ABT0QZF3_9MICO|nr:GNAT family N-acetyltransferase [Brachybacterium equifaecis]MCL6422613.1 GNAT family N-acetyltransferase [Brachybacterium equifaecis]
MTPEELLRLYDQQLRAEAEVADADEVTAIGPVLAAIFPARGRGFATARPIPAGTDVEALVAEVAAHFQSDPRVSNAEWKTRGHDGTLGLLDALARHGFRLEEVETIMAGDIDAVIAAESPIPVHYSLHRADTPALIREAEALAGRVFGDSPEDSARRADELVERDRRWPGSFEMWCVRDARGEIVCSGRVDPVPGSDFAGLWGGACAPEHRGLGLYRALTAARARSARERGVRFLQSDCSPMSRPILERAGLVPITTTTPAVWRR